MNNDHKSKPNQSDLVYLGDHVLSAEGHHPRACL